MPEGSFGYITMKTMTPSSTMEESCPAPDNYASNVDSSNDNKMHEDINFDEASFTTTVVNKIEIGVQTYPSKVKTFRSVKTQTDTNTLAVVEELSTMSKSHPDYKPLEEHNYSATSLESSDSPISPDMTGNQTINVNQKQTSTFSEPKLTQNLEPADSNSSDDEMVSKYEDDPEYSPSSSCDDTESDEEINDPVEERKWIIFESELDKLFLFCYECGNIITSKTKHCKGSMLTVKTTCLCGHSKAWQSQPLTNGAATGNLLIPAAILLSGNTYKHIQQFSKLLNMQIVSSTSYYKTQKKCLLPVIDNKWKSCQKEIINELKKEDHVDICGDGRCDSPGHSAKYGTYTVMDESTKKVVEFNVVQVTEATSSNAMEYEGCKRTLNSLKKKKVPIRCLTTDRHTTITAKMKSVYTNITHQYDVWHLSKWVTKKISKKAKKKSLGDLKPWIQAISNHLWWCAATCGGDPNMLKEKWLSLLYHIVDKHRWNGCKLFKKCAHPAMSRRERKSIKWLKAGSLTYVALEEIVTNKKLVNDLEKLTEFHHTGELEQYHSVLLKYAPKREHFSYNGMVARTQLAVLDHNSNVHRKQAVIQKGEKKGERRYNVVCPKQRNKWVAKPIKEPKSYEYINSMMKDVLKIKEGKKMKYKPVAQAQNISTIPKPPKQEVIAQHKTRMKCD